MTGRDGQGLGWQAPEPGSISAQLETGFLILFLSADPQTGKASPGSFQSVMGPPGLRRTQWG